MDFVHFLSSHMLDPKLGGKRLYRDVVEQAIRAEALGYDGVAVPEHHLVNILLIPSPLQMAVKIAAHTTRLRIMTSVCQLPLRDMRIFAGEVIQAQALCDGRLMLGVGKGAFAYETDRLGVPFAETKPRFEEALQVLEALLTREEVAWSGTHYNFPALTVMPRPEDPIPLMLGVMLPAGIEAAAAKGYHVQTTPLGAAHGQLEAQVAAFHRGRAAGGHKNRLSLQRGVYLVGSEAERRRMVDRAHLYYGSFDNVFGGPGIVDKGVIRPLPRAQTAEELGENILICQRDEMIDRLGAYGDLGIDEVIVTSVFGQPQEETLAMMERLATEVFPALRR
ncbi:LLM class flavin-dependent oxidoreductase [Stagnihabitans tardus]|uniref:LLM class flavin-dependent oxidoreductase n=1 Tax=Stagnihabitans tardus TaxID=2699202 RepID=A0AAE5BTK9_9RHOB|nr:LLM class flavin-dependent oxidoreductase [Stagnihabitans tardus]NBZ86302.1 LLM class flavin-dependent oxidoreductase [Stagnihabitans tardus]